mmetsp:Transcript_30996/g.30536  ORF Transcript_30996/g.30536 Transcript_30996/m.30536 type:complete len:223 (-) Transcript_30996:931-1599(-)|eukprot:CAMPEP_0197015676 /NCGR_PEP_ID=MMETSP1380-20130617/75171_1 /TAXON_ID=5936 /ORGANISM="Euplotes crassus, Strain CT5" /LENGTH=222 /DNA_ID=CAMNT_0042441771 /DNA_START=408 /DNA_END=1076 /DNA_ORIENTATION=-
MKERAKIAEHFGSSTKRPRNQREGTTSQWKGLDTTPSNVVRFTFLKQQLKSKEHPINQLIDEFHNWSEKKYYFLTESSVEQEDVDQVKDEIIRNTQQFIALMFLTTIKFYQLTMKDNENNRDILLEILTGLVVRKDLYLCISKTITYCKSAEIDILERKMSMEENVDFDKSEYIAGISDIFSFSGSRKYNKMLHMKSELPDTLYQDTESQLKEEKTSGKYAK